jgi:hypothetical protein
MHLDLNEEHDDAQFGRLKRLSSSLVQQFVFENENADPRTFVLRTATFAGLPSKLIAEQLIGRKAVSRKLPSYYRTPGIIYPPKLNLEQCSSEATASYKADIIAGRCARTQLIIDLTGGFGVDTFFFSRRFSKVIYVEPNGELLELARHNHRTLGCVNIEYINSSAQEFIKEFKGNASAIYIDPSRRDGNKKVAAFKDSVPDVLSLQDALFKYADLFFIKASPLLDISAGVKALKDVSEVFVVAVENDCKELLFEVQKSMNANPQISAVNISSDMTEVFTWNAQEEAETESLFAEPQRFLFEPNVSVLKGGAFQLAGARFGLAKLAKNTHLYTAEHQVPDFPGKIFRVEQSIASDPKAAKQAFPQLMANIISRNYPLSVHEICKKLRMREGGEKYLIATSTQERKYLLVCSRLK